MPWHLLDILYEILTLHFFQFRATNLQQIFETETRLHLDRACDSHEQLYWGCSHNAWRYRNLQPGNSIWYSMRYRHPPRELSNPVILIICISKRFCPERNYWLPASEDEAVGPLEPPPKEIFSKDFSRLPTAHQGTQFSSDLSLLCDSCLRSHNGHLEPLCGKYSIQVFRETVKRKIINVFKIYATVNIINETHLLIWLYLNFYMTLNILSMVRSELLFSDIWHEVSKMSDWCIF